MTKQTLYILIISILTTSCATIMNQSHKYVTVHTTKQSKIVYKQDTINTIDNKAHLKVERKKEALSFEVSADTLTKPVRINPKNSMMYWSNIIFNFGLGMFVDNHNPKRYTYPEKIYINSTDVQSKYYRYGKANNKGEVYLHLSLPVPPSFCFFLMKPENETGKYHAGMEIVAIGLDYYHSKNQFVHLGGSYYEGGSLGIKEDREYVNSYYFCLSNNHKIGRFSIGYGLSYAKNTWIYEKWKWTWLIIPVKTESVKKNHNAFGLTFPVYYQLLSCVNIGVVYRPTCYRPNMADRFSYEHLVSIDCAFKIRLKK